MEQYTQSLKRAAILADFERRLRDALKDDDQSIVEAIAERYLAQLSVAGRRFLPQGLPARAASVAGGAGTDLRPPAGRAQPEDVALPLRGLAASARGNDRRIARTGGDRGTLDPPPWAQILARFRAQVQTAEARGEEGDAGV